jgi:hypothetical protein
MTFVPAKMTIRLLALAGIAVAAAAITHDASAAPPFGVAPAGAFASADTSALVRVSLIPREIRCAAACRPRTGFGACVSRCVGTKQVCDSGLRNCRRL